MDDKIKLIDVGARGGIDARWQPYHAMLEVLAFEPDPTNVRRSIGNAIRTRYGFSRLPWAQKTGSKRHCMCVGSRGVRAFYSPIWSYAVCIRLANL